jgi:co-chaperonin GroES (HSP10)
VRLRPLRGRVAIRELHDKPTTIVLPDGYHKAHERDRTSHRGVVLGMGPPARTRKGAEVAAEFTEGSTVRFVFDADNGVEGGGFTEAARTAVWPPDGGPCVWVMQAEVIAVEEP